MTPTPHLAPHPNTTLPQTVAQYRTALHHPLHGATPPHGPPPRLGPVLPATPNPTMPCTHTAPLPPASTYLALLPPSSRCLRVCTASVGRGYSLEQSGYSPDHPSPPPLTQGHATAAPPRSHSRVALRSMTGETPAFRELSLLPGGFNVQAVPSAIPLCSKTLSIPSPKNQHGPWCLNGSVPQEDSGKKRFQQQVGRAKRDE